MPGRTRTRPTPPGARRAHRLEPDPETAQSAAQIVVLAPERAGPVAAEGAEVLGDERGLPLPCFGINGEQEVEVILVDV